MKKTPLGLISVFLLFISVVLTPGSFCHAFDISGDYKGFYQYYDPHRQNMVGHFTISVQQDGNRISGVIKEPRTSFGPQVPFLYSDFEGVIQGNEDIFNIDFVKVYRYKKNHTVHYHGEYKSINGEIQGEWNIGNYKGHFKISNVLPTPDLDFEQPDLLVVKPDYFSTAGNSKEAVKMVTVTTGTVSGFASDNVKIDVVYVNGQSAYLTTPTLKEQHVMHGNLVKFTYELPLQNGENPVSIKAVDINGNSKTLAFSMRPAGAGPVPQKGEVSMDNSVLYTQKYAVVIGIDQYNTWPPLECAVNDAKAVQRFLEGQGYRVITILDKDATRAGILKTMGYELPRLVNADDSVMIYFAGHGHTESLRDGGKEGYIIPVDAGTTDSFLTAISMRQLKSITQRIKAKHVLYIMDSCYSGLGFARSAGVSSDETDYIKKITSYRAVQMITAGGMNEPVIEENGHGLFTVHLLRALKGPADINKDGYITGSELGVYLRPLVTRKSGNQQTPNYGRFEGEGEYVFKVK